MIDRQRAPLWQSWALMLPVGAALAWLGWPGAATRVAADTPSYLAWPGYVTYGPGTFYIGARPPLYPILLKILGTGTALGMSQYLFSLAAWAALGWVLARRIGALTAAALALAPAVWVWNFIALTESAALSLMALALAGALLLARHWTRWRFATFGVSLAALALLHDKLLFIIPFFTLAAAFPQSRRRALLTLVLGACIFLAGAHGIKTHDRWQWGMINNVLGKVLPSPAMKQYFIRHGMPFDKEIEQASGRIGRAAIFPLQRSHPTFIRWIERYGHATYYRYIFPRLKSYTAPWGFLNMLTHHTFYQVYSGKDFPQPLVTRAARLFFNYALIPPAACPLLLAVLAAGFYCAGALETRRLAATGLLLFAAVYTQAFVVWHGDHCEIERHMLNAVALYRVVNGMALLVTIGVVREKWGRQSDANREDPGARPADQIDPARHAPG